MLMLELTRKLYLENSYQREFDADVLESSDGGPHCRRRSFILGAEVSRLITDI